MENWGFSSYFALLLLASGLLLLLMETTGYRMAKMEKERKSARLLGWFNTSLAILVFVSYWVYVNWFY